jgi:hypothetical protein
MRILPDECVPWPMHRLLSGHACSTVQDKGWGGINQPKDSHCVVMGLSQVSSGGPSQASLRDRPTREILSNFIEPLQGSFCCTTDLGTKTPVFPLQTPPRSGAHINWEPNERGEGKDRFAFLNLAIV